MAAPRFRVFNPAGALVVDRNAPGVYFLGRATHISTVQPSGDVNTLNGRNAGESLFEFTSALPVIPAIELKDGCVVRMSSKYGMSRSGNTLQIRLYCGTSTLDANGFATQVTPEVYMFGRVGSVGGLGLRLRDDAGNVTHAYTDSGPPPLWCRSRVSESGASLDLGSARSIASFGKPAALSWPRHSRVKHNWTSTTTRRSEEWDYGWRWSSSAPSSLYLAEAKSSQYRDNEAGPPKGSDSDVVTLRPSDTLILNATNL
jgi:hypothetical protein